MHNSKLRSRKYKEKPAGFGNWKFYGVIKEKERKRNLYQKLLQKESVEIKGTAHDTKTPPSVSNTVLLWLEHVLCVCQWNGIGGFTADGGNRMNAYCRSTEAFCVRRQVKCFKTHFHLSARKQS